MVLLMFFSWISFQFLGLTDSITGGLLTGLEDALAAIGGLIPGFGTILGVIGGAFLGLIMILLFPIHWALFYRPWDIMLLISLTLPWILACTVASAISSKTPKKGVHTSLAIGIGFLIPAVLIYAIIPLIPGIGPLIAGIINGLSTGLTDLPYLLAVFTAILEGCLIGAVFGGFIGSLRYKGSADGKTKVKKAKGGIEDTEEPTLDTSDFCTNCGAKLLPGNDFCTNCGNKL